MAIGYREWLDRTGLPATKQNAFKWKTTHGVALGKYNPDGTPITSTPPAPPAPPTPDPYLTPEGFGAAADPAAQSQIADLLAEYRNATGGTIDASGNFVAGPTQGNIGSQYTQLVNQLAARRPAIEQSRRDQLNSITSDMAGRGLLRSGINEVAKTRANTDAATQLGEVERGIQQAGTDQGVALSQAADRLLRGRQGIENQANAGYVNSRIQDFQNAYGGAPVTPETPPITQPKPVSPGQGLKTGARKFVYANRKRAR
jgi:hypothetical protein